MFIGREKELEELVEKINNNRFESILIYGRRRIGKTELIKEATKSANSEVIYYECKRALLNDNLKDFNNEINNVLKTEFTFDSFRKMLKYLFELSKEQKLILIIDEFPFLIEANKTIVSDLRDFIDEYNSISKMKIILSGSFVEVMKSLNDGASETYGRFTSIIPLEPFDYFDSSKFYSNYKDEEKILMYSIFGGVAFINKLINSKITPLENIKNLILEKNSILQLEVENTIISEINKISLANSVLNIFSEGSTKYSDVVNKITSDKSNKVSPDYIFKKLINLEIIEKVAPINDVNNKKRTFYRFKDNLMEFYYRYIYRYKNANSYLSVDDFYEEFVKEDLMNKYLPYKFENISKEFLIRANKAHKINPLFYDIGTYSFNDEKHKINRQFDLVTKDKNGYISYECKYKNKPISRSVIHEEEYQILNSGLNVYKLGFISKSGFDEGVEKDKYNLFTLDDFYKFE